VNLQAWTLNQVVSARGKGELPFEVYTPPAFTRISPPRGGAAGGVPITLTLSLPSAACAPAARCRFGGGTAVDATCAPPLEYRCTAPAGGVGEVEVAFALNGADFVGTGLVFEYVLPVRLLAFRPGRVLVGMPVTLTVSGENFRCADREQVR